MKQASINAWANSELIHLKQEDDLEGYRVAGKITSGALNLLESLIKKETNLSLIQLDKLAEEYIRDNGCTPTFKNYRGYPNASCISVNTQLVHSIPTAYKLNPGDLVSFDLGATYKNKYIGDSARTFYFIEPKSEIHQRLINATKEALKAGIEAIVVGARIGVIGEAIYKVARAHGFQVINTYGGHGISYDVNNVGIPHSSPFVANRSTSFEGARIQTGQIIAIEPLLVLGNSTNTTVSSDKWTVNCGDICSHEELSLYVHEDHVEILT